jgi:hypothetical protein
VKLLSLDDHLLNKVLAATLPRGTLIKIRLFDCFALLSGLINFLIQYLHQLLFAYLLHPLIYITISYTILCLRLLSLKHLVLLLKRLELSEAHLELIIHLSDL